MLCPNCKKETLEKINFRKVRADKCTRCLGIWFDQDELRIEKDETDRYLQWLDIDIWKQKEKFRVSPSQRKCPVCKEMLYEVEYGKSNIKIDVCNSCKGIWLDRGEFKKIIIYLKNTVDTASLSLYFKRLFKEAKEIFTGPEKLSSEIKDFLIVFKLFRYRFISQYPIIETIINNFPFTK